MRIIGGALKGRVIKVPKDLDLRPTTDFAMEGLFNILNNSIDLEGAQALDLFSGTGHISLELASRGCSNVLSVDNNFKCIGFLRSTASSFDLPVSTYKSDVFNFLKSCSTRFDLIFADPPYELEGIADIHKLVFERSLLKKDGMLIIEHGPKTKLEHLQHFSRHRKYGNVNFSFFTVGSDSSEGAV